MCNVLHKVTGEFLESVNTPDFDPAVWAINPNMGKMLELDKKYWKVDTGMVVSMSDVEKATVDSDLMAKREKAQVEVEKILGVDADAADVADAVVVP